MFMRILCIFAIALSFSVQSHAKTATKAKAKPKSYKNVPLTFDLNYYSSLRRANRLKYLTYINDIAVKSAQYNEKMRGGRKSALLLDFIMDSAEAARTCFSGGLAYTADTCGTLPAELQGATGTFNGCASATQQRCSFAFGINEGKSALCYEKANEGRATTECNNLASSTGSIQRLNQELDRCLPLLPSNLACKKLTEALKNDTQSDTYKTYCTSNASRGHCQKTQTAIAQLNTSGTPGETNQLPGDEQSCAEADSKLYNSTLSTALNGTPNPKWQKMIEMSVQACGGPGVLSLDTQKDKFGMCLKGGSGSSDQPGNLERAINEVTHPAYGDASTRNAPEVVAAFQEYFGLTPREFTDAFCSGDTASFHRKISGLRDVIAPSDKFDPVSYMGAMFNDPQLRSRTASMPDRDLAAKLNAYAPVHDAFVVADTAFRNADDQCKREKAADAAGVANSLSGICTQVDGLRAKMVEANRPNLDMQRQIRNYVDPKLNVAQPSYNHDPVDTYRFGLMQTMIGNANIEAYKKSLYDDRSFNLRGNTVSPKAVAARKELKDCLNSAINIAEGPDHGADVFTPNTNSGQNCHREYIPNVLAGGFNGMLRVRMIGASANDTSPLANQCFTSNAEIVTRNITIPGCKKAIKGTNSKYPDQQICVDDPAKIEVYAMKCGPVTSETIREGEHPTDR